MELKFYRCNHCGNIVTFAKSSGVPVMCCGEKMQDLNANTTDASAEKHVPLYSVENGVVTVRVGSAPHPMADVHYIEWVALQTKSGFQLKYLNPGDAPEAVFALASGDELEAVYAYCNLHGLWKA